ncbi:MAG: DUF4411 family protein [Chthoniobacterales bacterium]|nr:DUF4411 family protein [Gemmatimonadaceae bacterium]MBA3833117.1 DUF4411 family protein [Chthoniobacterales bacterium]
MYSIDSSALIDGWVRYYPPDILPTLWNNVDRMVLDGRLRATEEVKFELERGADALYGWCCDRASLFLPPTDEVQRGVADIVNRFPSFVPERSPDGIWADPYVISLAKIAGFAVITGERRAADNARRPKIPNVCEAVGVECIPFLELIRREGWRF